MRSILNTTPVRQLADTLVSVIDTTFEEKVSSLNAVALEDRLKLAMFYIQRQLTLLRMSSSLTDFLDGTELKARMLPIVPRKKGDSGEVFTGSDARDSKSDDNVSDEAASVRLRAKLDAIVGAPQEVRRTCAAELRKLASMERTHNLGPEHQKSVTYLEWLLALPWNTASRPEGSQQVTDIKSARACLDNDHFGGFPLVTVLSWEAMFNVLF